MQKWLSTRAGRRPGRTAWLVRYGVAVALVALATAARLRLDSWIGQEVLPYAFLYLAVAVTAWWIGLGPALTASALGLTAGLWLIVPPRRSLVLRGFPELLEVLLYLVVTGTFVFLIDWLRKAKEQAQANVTLADRKQRMDRLIQDSLNYSRAVRGKLRMQPVDLSRLLRDLFHTYPNLQEHEHHIHIESDLPRVLGNEAALAQCFSNLLGNAVKFTDPGRELRVLVRAEANDQIARVWVEDNGIGIPPHIQKQLFHMFQRHHTGGEGTGIGLAIVRKLTQRMGGKAGVESLEGKGSRFWLELHLASPEEEAEPEFLEEKPEDQTADSTSTICGAP